MITRSFRLRPMMLGRTILRCDGPTCSPRRRLLSRNWSPRKARALAARYGWVHRYGRDLCAGCVAPSQPFPRSASPRREPGPGWAATVGAVAALRQGVGVETRYERSGA
jgi:hypothetical protein